VSFKAAAKRKVGQAMNRLNLNGDSILCFERSLKFVFILMAVLRIMALSLYTVSGELLM
jgi:hypothetical protein